MIVFKLDEASLGLLAFKFGILTQLTDVSHGLLMFHRPADVSHCPLMSYTAC
jgi:hypothetical protein